MSEENQLEKLQTYIKDLGEKIRILEEKVGELNDKNAKSVEILIRLMDKMY